MKPTYTPSEISLLIDRCDSYEGLSAIHDLLDEERTRYHNVIWGMLLKLVDYKELELEGYAGFDI